MKSENCQNSAFIQHDNAINLDNTRWTMPKSKMKAENKQATRFLTQEHFSSLSFEQRHCTARNARRRAASDYSTRLRGSRTGISSLHPRLLGNSTCAPGHPARTAAVSPLKAWPRRAGEGVLFAYCPAGPIDVFVSDGKWTRRLESAFTQGTPWPEDSDGLGCRCWPNKAGYSCPSSHYVDKQYHRHSVVQKVVTSTICWDFLLSSQKSEQRRGMCSRTADDLKGRQYQTPEGLTFCDSVILWFFFMLLEAPTSLHWQCGKYRHLCSFSSC